MTDQKSMALAAASATPHNAADSFAMVLERAVRDPSIDPAKLAQMMDLMERAQARQAKQAYLEAMSDCQAKMRPVAQDANNPQTRSKYASYGALDNALRPMYTGHGFALSFGTEDAPKENEIRVYCKVTHRNGHEERPHLDMPNDGKGAKGGDVMTKTHATMSAVSYARRGLLKMVFNISEGEFDDDGNGATVRGDDSRLSGEQQAQINKLLSDAGLPIEPLLKWAKVSALGDIPAERFSRVLEAVKASVNNSKKPK